MKGNTKKITLRNKEETRELLKAYHIHYGHSGKVTTYGTLNKFFKAARFWEEIQLYIDSCIACYKAKFNYGNKTNKNKIKIESRHKFEKISMDIYGPINLSNFSNVRKGNKAYLLTITDTHTRLSEIYDIKNIRTIEIIRGCKKWFEKYGKPKIIISDNGLQFTSSEFESFLKNSNVHHLKIPIYSPSSNGISERINRTIGEVLRLNRGKSLGKIIEIAIKRLNFTFNTAIKGLPIMQENNPEKIVDTSDSLTTGPENHRTDIKNNDLIFVKKAVRSGKDDDCYVGPFKVVEVSKKGLWIKIDGEKAWIHRKNIKKWKGENSKILGLGKIESINTFNIFTPVNDGEEE